MRHPAFLYQPAFHSDFRGDRGNHARMVRLYSPDRDQRVGVGSNRIGHNVFELAQLVAAESQPRMAILAFGVKLDLAAQMRAEAFQLLDMRGSESKGVAFEFLQHASAFLSSAPMVSNLTLT